MLCMRQGPALTAPPLYEQAGGNYAHTIGSLYRGLAPRLFRITCCCYIYDGIKGALEGFALRRQIGA